MLSGIPIQSCEMLDGNVGQRGRQRVHTNPACGKFLRFQGAGAIHTLPLSIASMKDLSSNMYGPIMVKSLVSI